MGIEDHHVIICSERGLTPRLLHHKAQEEGKNKGLHLEIHVVDRDALLPSDFNLVHAARAHARSFQPRPPVPALPTPPGGWGFGGGHFNCRGIL